MNDRMWAHPATRSNVETLEGRGAIVVPPATGELASRGEWGTGRLAEPPEILAAIEGALGGGPYAPRSLDGLRLLVTAGGTREPIDSVRFVGNRSSGRMGVAIASEAARRGAEVTVVAANVSLPRADGVRYVDVETAEQLRDAVRAEFPGADALVMAAAVADFRPAAPVADKIPKSGRDGLTVELVATPDVLAELSGERRPGQIVVGFAAEHGEGAVERGRRKLEGKHLDAVVVNDISRADIGFDVPENEVTVITAGGTEQVPRASKAQVAAAILDAVERLRTRAGEAQRS
jgi:phosphopantothenoylcysteine decarboxylase / phosphopantothenate---cysteine ligase